jgi:HD superfamily phosphohydrolase
MQKYWTAFPLNADDVAKVAVGPSKWPGGASEFTPWLKLMTDIVTGDAFGVDRIDYLLRDSLHAGVAYGRFDHYRLIDTLRILPSPVDDRPVIGIEIGGIHAAEALQQARYFMFSQLYLHRVRRAYDAHLRAFLKAWLPDGRYKIDLDSHLGITDNEVLVAIHRAAADESLPGHDPARRIVERDHYRVLYERRAEDRKRVLNPEKAVHHAAARHFGEEAVSLDVYRQGSQSIDFAVLRDDDTVVSSLQESEILNRIPGATALYVFVVPEKRVEAKAWLAENLEAILLSASESDHE